MRKAWPLGAVLALALLLRLVWIDRRGIIYDDAFSILLSGRSLGEIISGTAADTMPPLYYFLLHIWQQISREVWFLRLLSVTLNLIGVTILYHLVRGLFNRRAGLLAGFFAAVSPLLIYHAQDLRMYALLSLAQLAYAYCFFRLFWQADGRPARSWWVGFVFAGVVAMYTHNLAVFGLVVPDALLLARRRWRDLGRLLLGQAVIGLLALPWVVLIPGQVAKIQGAVWISRPGFLEAIQALLYQTIHLPLDPIPLAIGAILAVQILVSAIWFATLDHSHNNAWLFLAGFALIPPVLLFTASYMIHPVFLPRGFILSTFAYLGLVGAAAASQWKKGLGVFLAGSVFVSAIVSLPSLYRFDQFPRSPFAQAAAWLVENSQPDEIVIHDNKLSHFPMHVFEPDLPQVFLKNDTGPFIDTLALPSQQAMHLFPVEGIEQAVNGHDRFYFVVFQQAIDEYEALDPQTGHPVLAWLDSRYTLVRKVSFSDLWVLEYER
jgi:uncharacterized membrane protein